MAHHERRALQLRALAVGDAAARVARAGAEQHLIICRGYGHLRAVVLVERGRGFDPAAARVGVIVEKAPRDHVERVGADLTVDEYLQIVPRTVGSVESAAELRRDVRGVEGLRVGLARHGAFGRAEQMAARVVAVGAAQQGLNVDGKRGVEAEAVRAARLVAI